MRITIFFLLLIATCSKCLDNSGLHQQLLTLHNQLNDLVVELQKQEKVSKSKKLKLRNVKRWKKLATEYGQDGSYRSGYVFFSGSLFKGKRANVRVKQLLQATDVLQKREVSLKLGRQYKIHLMPKVKQMAGVLRKLLDELKKDPQLQQQIYKFKVYPRTESDDQYYNKPIEEAFARIVIYPTDGKKNVQQLLDKLYKLFKGVAGINVTPRYNAKVTSLIYVAQGDAGVKKREEFANLFELPDKIYYNTEQIPAEFENHYLSHPSTGMWLLKTD